MSVNLNDSIQHIDERMSELQDELQKLSDARVLLIGLNENSNGDEPKSKAKSKESKQRSRRNSNDHDDDELATRRQRVWLKKMDWEGDLETVTKSEASLILEELFDENDEQRAAAEKEISRARPRRNANSNGGEASKPRRSSKKAEPEDDDDEATIADAIRLLSEEGMTPKDIAAETGANISYVYLIRRQMKAEA